MAGEVKGKLAGEAFFAYEQNLPGAFILQGVPQFDADVGADEKLFSFCAREGRAVGDEE